MLLAPLIKGLAFIGWGEILGRPSKDDIVGDKGGVLFSARGGMGQSDECFADVSWHGCVHLSVHIIPCQFYSAVQSPRPVDFDGILLLDCRNEVAGVLLPHVLHPKVVHDKGKSDGARDMLP